MFKTDRTIHRSPTASPRRWIWAAISLLGAAACAPPPEESATDPGATQPTAAVEVEGDQAPSNEETVEIKQQAASYRESCSVNGWLNPPFSSCTIKYAVQANPSGHYVDVSVW